MNIKLSGIIIEGRKRDKRREKQNITNIYDAQNEVIKFHKDYFSMIFNTVYDAKHGKWLKILTPNQIL